MMTENIAEKIREDRKPEGEAFTLSAEATRLHRSLTVLDKWLDVAFRSDEGGPLYHKAQAMYDRVEEELSRTAYRMEVLKRRREWSAAGREAGDEGAVDAATLSDALLRVYCILRDVPAEAFGGEGEERDKYAHMGAVMVAQEAANAEMERVSV